MKRTIQRLFAATLLCLLFTALFALPASAATIPVISAESVKTNGGTTVDVVISLDKNPGIWSMGLTVGYDHSALTLKGTKAGSIFTADEITPPPSLDKETYFFLGSKVGLSNTTATGTLVTLTFAVNKGAENKDYPITLDLSSANTINAENEEVAFQTTAGTVKIEKVLNANTPGTGESSTGVVISILAMLLCGMMGVLLYWKKMRK